MRAQHTRTIHDPAHDGTEFQAVRGASAPEGLSVRRAGPVGGRARSRSPELDIDEPTTADAEGSRWWTDAWCIIRRRVSGRATHAEEWDRLGYALQRHIAGPFEREPLTAGRVHDRSARQDLARCGSVGDARSEIDGLPEDVEISLDHRAGMHTGMRRQCALGAHHVDQVESGIDAGARIR